MTDEFAGERDRHHRGRRQGFGELAVPEFSGGRPVKKLTLFQMSLQEEWETRQFFRKARNPS